MIKNILRPLPLLASLPAAVCGGYVGALTVAAKRHRPSTDTDRSVRFVFVVPAHNEAFGITDTITSLRSVDYPRHLFRVVVIADNCTDDTASVARAAGAQVIERVDHERKSKGFALSDCLPKVLDDPLVDAVVVVDADTIVSPNILLLAAGRIAAGEHALQVRYGVRNPDDTWRTQLLSIAFACFHDVRSSGREELKLSCGLRGNGMVFTRHALDLAPHRASSLVEDLEHGLDLAEQGIRVSYVHGASVLAEMPTSASAASTQRDRWERGRASFRPRAFELLRMGMRRGDRVAIDLAADVLVPPLGAVAAMTGGSLIAAVGTSLLRRRPDPSLIPAAVAAVGLGAHVTAGWRESGTGTRGLVALGQVPNYLFWKVAERRRSSAKPDASDVWVRTARNGAEESQGASSREGVGTESGAIAPLRLASGSTDERPMEQETVTQECAS